MQSLLERARLGGLSRVRLHGNPGTQQGRSKGGKATIKLFKSNPSFAQKLGFVVSKSIRLPRHCDKLAEFLGVMLGDGGIRSKYQCAITFDYRKDLRYAKDLSLLVNRLFGVSSIIRKRSNGNGADLIISSVKVVEFLLKQGLVLGNKVKQQVDVPDWIKNNLEYSYACLRGLMDTDGGVYYHQYKVKNKAYSYLRLSFTNCSKP